MGKYLFALACGFSGCVAVIAQAILLREMLIVFRGNELSIAMVFFCCLTGTAAGSLLSAKHKDRLSATNAMRYPLIFATGLLPVIFLGIRFLRPIAATIPDTGLSLIIVPACSLALFVPLGILFGFQYACAGNIRTAYFSEASGYLIGGIIFTYLMLPMNNAVLMVLSVCLAIPIFLLLTQQLFIGRLTRLRTMAVAGIIVVMAGLFWGAKTIDSATLALSSFPGYRIIASHYSPYGHAVIAERNGELHAFSNGIPLASMPDENAVFSESFAYIPYLFQHHAKTVLVIGSAAPILPYLCREPIEKITYIENNFLAATTLAPAVPALITDARKFLSSTDSRFDLIYINLPYSTTAGLNRYYTEEFFRATKHSLNESGVIAFRAPGALVYLDSVMTNLNYSLWTAAHAIFSDVHIVAGQNNIFIASSTPLPPAVIVAGRIKQLAVKPIFLSKEYLLRTLDPEKTAWLYDQFKSLPEKNYRNRDFTPHGLLRGLLYRQSTARPKTTAIYTTVMRYAWTILALLLLWLVYLRTGLTGAAFSSGAVTMGLFLSTLWSFQVVHGTLYHWLGMAVALFLAARACGAGVMTKSRFRLPLLDTELLFALWAMAGCLLMTRPQPLAVHAGFVAGSGFLLGYQFPLINNRSGVSIYASQAMGAAVTALIFGIILIPAWGIPNAFLAIVAMQLITLPFWLKQ